MTDDRPPEVRWLHYRLAVAFCSAFVACVMLLLVPLILAIAGLAEVLVIYPFVFSKWGVAAILSVATLGFVVGGERMANFFAIIWGTHRFWSELEEWLYEVGDWLDEHRTAAGFLAVASSLLVVGVFWYSFR